MALKLLKLLLKKVKQKALGSCPANGSDGGLKFREIADVVNISENTVKSTILRAIKKIRKHYDHSLSEGAI